MTLESPGFVRPTHLKEEKRKITTESVSLVDCEWLWINNLL